MTDASDFLAAIIDRPDDDLPRLVFADYLEERGDAERAEFIRVQCELARLPDDHEERSMLGARETLLLEANRPRWVIPNLKGSQVFRRGFVEVVETAAEWLLAADRPFDRAPIRDLRIATVDWHIDSLVQVPGLDRIEALNLQANFLGGGDRLERLFRQVHFHRLTWLSLQNNGLWVEGLAAFTRVPVAKQLTTLHLSGNRFADEGVTVLAQSPVFANLRSLILRNDEVPFSESIHADGAAALAQSPTLTKLRELNLSGHYIGDAGLINLVSSRNAAGLVDLDVSYNNIGDMGERAMEALVESPYLGNLRRLNLAGYVMNRLAVQALMRWPRLRDGVQVDIRNAELSDSAWELVAHSEFTNQISVTPPEQE